MLRRLIALTALAAGMSIAAAITLATPALAKGPSQARITGPGLTHATVVSGNGEPGQEGKLSTLAVQTGLFFVLFGPNAGAPPQLRTPSPKGSLGPQYTIIYTVPGGITSHPDEQFGQIRQDLLPTGGRRPARLYTTKPAHWPIPGVWMAPGQPQLAPYPCPARHSILSGHTGSLPGAPSTCRTPAGGAAGWPTTPALAHRVRRGHRGRSTRLYRAGVAPPQARRHPRQPAHDRRASRRVSLPGAGH